LFENQLTGTIDQMDIYTIFHQPTVSKHSTQQQMELSKIHHILSYKVPLTNTIFKNVKWEILLK
jgi:hypothetical protein